MFFCNTPFITSFLIVFNWKVVEMLSIVLANSFNQSKWSPKLFCEDKTKGTRIFSTPIGGGKIPPHTKNEVSRGQWSLVASPKFYAIFPLEKIFQWSIQSWYISYSRIASPSRHVCNWFKRFVGVLVLIGIKIEFKLYILPFFYGLDSSNDHFVEVCFHGDNIWFWGWSLLKF